MALLDSPDVFGTTIFCDDIRTEIDGKVTFVGVYSQQMFIHGEFPVTLPKFSFGIIFVQKKSVFEANLGIRIFLPGDADDAPSVQADLSEGHEGAILAAASASPDTPQAIVVLRSNLVLAPLEIKQAGAIKVRIARRGDLVRLGALEVTGANPTPIALSS